MARSYKLENENYIDTKGIVHNKVLLSEVLKNMSKNPIGELVLWEGNKLITNNGTYQFIGTYYNIYEMLLKRFPLKEGFKRKYMIALDYTDSKPTGNVYIRFSFWTDINDRAQERLFHITCGDCTDGVRRVDILPAPDFSVYTPHMNMYCTPDFATGRTS